MKKSDIYFIIFAIIFIAGSTIKAWASNGTGLPANLFEYGFAGAGYLILGYFCYRLLNMVKEQAEDYKILITNNTRAMEELKSAIEGKLLGK